MSLKLSAVPATAVSLAPSDLLYLAKDMGGSFLENKLPVSVLDARYALSGSGVTSFNTRTGAVTFLAADLTSVNGAFTTNPLSQFAATTSAQLAGVISDETGSPGLLVFNGNPTIAGAVLSNLLQFSGTTHAGIRLNNLNTVNRNALTATAGDSIFNTDTLRFEQYDGTAWRSYVLTTGDTMTGNLIMSVASIQTNAAASTIAADQNNYAISAAGYLRIDATGADRTITGMTGGVNGRHLKISNVGSFNILFADQSASSTAANRIITGTGASITVAAGQTAEFIYNSVQSRWQASGLGYAAAGASPPFLDTNSLVMGSGDATKLLRFEVDGFTTATTRVLTPPNANATIAGLEVAQTFTAVQTFGANLLFTPDNTFDIGATLATRPRTVYVGTSLLVEKPALGAATSLAVQVVNPTAAAAGAQQFSPALQLTGQGWKTNAVAASQSVDWRIFTNPTEGLANPSSFLNFASSVNGAAFASVVCFSKAGSLLLGGTVAGALADLGNFLVFPAGGVILDNATGASITFEGGTGTILLAPATSRVAFSGTSSSFPAIKRNAAGIDFRLADDSAYAKITTGDIQMSVASLFSVTSGTNTRAGNATLVAGTVTVGNTTISANSIVLLTRKTSGGTIGTSIQYTLSAGTSFTITSDSVLDTSTFSYFILENP